MALVHTTEVSTEPSKGGVAEGLKAIRSHLLTVLLFSCAINILYLSSPIYLIQVYNRVLVSGSVETLIMLTVILIAALSVMGVVDAMRTKVLIRCGMILDQKLSSKVFSSLIERACRQGFSRGSQQLKDLDDFRTFITGTGVHFAFDIPWIPIYIAILYAINPILGTVGLLGALLLLSLAYINDRMTKQPMEKAQAVARKSYSFTEGIIQHADVIRSMGMQPSVERHWANARAQMLGQQAYASDRNALVSASIRFARLLVQSLMLGIGAWLAINGEIMPATIFAASIIMGRALVPVEQSVAAWKQASAARSGYLRVRELLDAFPMPPIKTIVPIKEAALVSHQISYLVPRVRNPILSSIDFTVNEGEALAIIGASGSGKSTLARLLCSSLSPTEGEIKFGGLDYRHWDPSEFGRQTGYLPQDVGLFAGTVRQNIARFSDASTSEIIEAATLAGIHPLILDLPNQYDTMLGPGGFGLSGGQRQRIGLARALLGQPRLLILDEPDAHLDIEGERALRDVIFLMKARGAVVVVVTHQPALLSVMDKVMLLEAGKVKRLQANAEGVPLPNIMSESTNG